MEQLDHQLELRLDLALVLHLDQLELGQGLDHLVLELDCRHLLLLDPVVLDFGCFDRP